MFPPAPAQADSAPPSTPALRTPWLEVGLAALPAALHAVLVLGRLHPDEVFQSLEPALHRAFGFGVLAWEWQSGLRNHAVPILFSWLLQGAAMLGLNDVLARRVVLEVPQLALHAAMLAAVWRLAARRVGPARARAVLWLTALYAPVLWFGGRTMSESFSTAFLVWGLERLDLAGPGRTASRAWLLGGALLGLSVVARYGSLAVVAPALLWLVLTRRFVALGAACAAGLVVAGLLGWLDLVTWGRWFHSLRAYVDFNLLSGASAAQFGAQPAWYYLPRLALAPWAVVGLVLGVRQRDTRCTLLVAAASGYLLVLSLTAHKEDRFLYPALVLLAVAGTPAFVAWVADGSRRLFTRAVGAASLLGGALFFMVPSPLAPQRPEQFQLELLASRGATGLVMMNEGLWGSGGYFYLGQNLPWCPCDFPHEPCFQAAAVDPRFNRGLYWANSPDDTERNQQARAAFLAAGFRVAAERGPATLFER